MVPAGIVGGFIGAKLNHKLSSEKIITVFNVVLLFIIGVNILNTMISVSNIANMGN